MDAGLSALKSPSSILIGVATTDGLANKVLAAEYQAVLPDEKLLAEELDKTRRELDARRVGQGGKMDARP